jgi:hypothetical protein
MRELVGELTVVRHQNEALAGEVETTDVEHAANARRQQVDHPWPASRVASGRNDARRLVDGEVLQPRARQRFAVDANLLTSAIDAGAKFRYHLPIDLDAAFDDELLALATAGDAGGGENLLQTLAFAWSTGSVAAWRDGTLLRGTPATRSVVSRGCRRFAPAVRLASGLFRGAWHGEVHYRAPAAANPGPGHGRPIMSF